MLLDTQWAKGPGSEFLAFRHLVVRSPTCTLVALSLVALLLYWCTGSIVVVRF